MQTKLFWSLFKSTINLEWSLYLEQNWEIRGRDNWPATYYAMFLFVVCFSFTEAIINQELNSEGHSHLFCVYSNSINCTWFNIQLCEGLTDQPCSGMFPPPPLHIRVAFMFYMTYWTLLFVPVPHFLVFPTRLIWRTELMNLLTSLPVVNVPGY